MSQILDINRLFTSEFSRNFKLFFDGKVRKSLEVLTNFHKDNLWVLLLLRSQNLSYWNLNLFLDYFVIFDSELGHSAIILKQTLILGIRN